MPKNLCCLFIAFAQACFAGGHQSSPIADPVPHYLLKLNLNEFSILSAAEVDGLLKYGGSGDFKLQMAKDGNEISWTVTIDNPRLMELLGIFVGEKTVKLVQCLDPSNIHPSEKAALQAIKSLSEKLEYARLNPVWDQLKLSGIVLPQGTNWMLQTSEGNFKLVGERLEALKTRNGKPVVADGFVKMPGQFDVLRFIDQKTNTLELFVMSFCPFGQKAETKLYSFLESTNVTQKPKLEVRYLFYKQQKDGKDVFVSLHGEEEIIENLVQMVLRDRYAPVFEHYVLQRASSGNVPWRKLLEQVGEGKPLMDEIETAITTQRDALIHAEYNYVTGQYGITDGSPSYVWESERVMDLTKVDRFKALKDFTGEACNK